MIEQQTVPLSQFSQLPAALPGASNDQATTYEQQINSLALDIVAEARVKLMMAFRFLNTALWKMPETIAWHSFALATNGKELFVSPLCVFGRFEEGMNQVVRDYLHVLLHCIFRHPFDTEHINVEAWSLACDIAVEAIALEMTENRFYCENNKEQQEALAALQAKLGTLDPAKLYRVFADAQVGGPRAKAAGLTAAFLWDARQLFQRDDHDAWANVQHKESDAQRSEDNKGVRKRNLSDRLQDSAEDGHEQQQNENGEQSDNTEDNAETNASQAGNQQDDMKQDCQQCKQQGGNHNGEQQEPQEEDNAHSASASVTTEDGDEDAADKDATDKDATDKDATDKDTVNEDATDKDATEEDTAAACGDIESTNNESADVSDERAAQQPQLDLQQQPNLQQQPDLQQQQAWEDIAKHIEMDVQSFSHGAGTNTNALTQNLAIANRRLANYGDFLRKFAVMGEDMKINDDEFDYIYYTYGLNTYKNMPLVEPLEYQESKRVREFVIALDTSGSCSGALIRTFVTRTYDILRETQGFGDKVNIHLIQCDNKIQADLKIENVSDLEKYCQTFQAFGFGGTDFRPVFTYVDELCEQGEFENLRGLIYFTDGLGTFPALPPAYETAFVFIDDGASRITVPPWAMRVVMNEDEILGL